MFKCKLFCSQDSSFRTGGNEKHVTATSALIQIFSAFTATGQIHSTPVYIKANVIFFSVAGSQWTLFSVNH